MDPARLPWEDARPDPVAERDRVLAAARARLPEIGRQGAQVVPIAAQDLVEGDGDDRVAALEQELAASEAARAELIERLQRAERSLAETQLRLLEAERKASTRDDVPEPTPFTAPRDERSSFATRPRPHLHPTGEADRLPLEEPSPILTSLRERISELRSALDEAEPDVPVEEPIAAPLDEPGPALPSAEDAEAFRERLARAAEARHRIATE